MLQVALYPVVCQGTDHGKASIFALYFLFGENTKEDLKLSK